MRIPKAGPRGLDRIEAEIDADRAALQSAAERLATTPPAAALSRAAGWAGAAMRAAAGQVAAHPIAFGLTAAGLAWLTLARKAPSPPPLAGSRAEALARWEDEGGAPPSQDPALEPWEAESDRLRGVAAGLMRRIEQARRGGLADARALDAQAKEVLAALTRDVRQAMARGLEDLGQSARAAALAAREAAYVARLSAADASRQTIRRHPWPSAAVLAAGGAALALTLPQSRREARLMGALGSGLGALGLWLFQDEIDRVSGIALDLGQALARDMIAAQGQIEEAATRILTPQASR